jgi:hypothetical protein
MPQGLTPNVTWSHPSKNVRDYSKVVQKTLERFSSLARRYRAVAHEPYRSHYWLDIEIKKFREVIMKSKIFNLDFAEDEVVATDVRQEVEGLEDLERLLKGIQILDSEPTFGNTLNPALRNFFENYFMWLRTCKNFKGEFTPVNVAQMENPKLYQLRQMTPKQRKAYWRAQERKRAM